MCVQRVHLSENNLVSLVLRLIQFKYKSIWCACITFYVLHLYSFVSALCGVFPRWANHTIDDSPKRCHTTHKILKIVRYTFRSIVVIVVIIIVVGTGVYVCVLRARVGSARCLVTKE